MRIKKIHKICMVNGCHNLVSYSITQRHQLGNSVNICKRCLKDALAAISETENPKEDETFKCNVCGKVCKSEAGLKAHLRSHMEE